MNIYFSIVIPAYNASLTIENCLDSIRNQTIQNYEIVIVNDGSVDNTDDVITRYVHMHPSLKIHYEIQENGGAASARNKCIQNAQGKYICFLDADDSWMPNKLEVVYNEIQNSGADVYYHDVAEVSVDGRQKALHFRQLEEDAMSDLIINGNQLATSSVVVLKSKLMESNTFAKGGFAGEDIECWVSLAQHGASFQHIPIVLSSYNRNENSLTMRNLKYIESTNMMLIKLFDLLESKYSPAELKKYKQRQERKNNIVLADFYYKNRKWHEAARLYGQKCFNHLNIRSIVFCFSSMIKSFGVSQDMR